MSGDYNPFDLDRDDQADKNLKARMASETEEDDFKWLMGSKRGRRIVWRTMEQSGVFRPTFNTNAMQMAFNEGFRNFGNRTLALIHKACPELYPQMMKEQTNGRESDGTSRNIQ